MYWILQTFDIEIIVQMKYSMVQQNWPPGQKYAINKKFTIFTQFLWHFAKMTISWAGHFDKVSQKLGKNYGFFINSAFLSRWSILLDHTVYIHQKSSLKKYKMGDILAKEK